MSSCGRGRRGGRPTPCVSPPGPPRDGLAENKPTKDDAAEEKPEVDPATDGSGEEATKTKQEWLDTNWEWPCYDSYYNRQGELIERVLRTKSIGDEEEEPPFQVTYCLIHGLPWPERVDVELQSPQLLKVMQKVFSTKQKLRYVKTVSIKGREFYLKLDELKKHIITDVSMGTESSDADAEPLSDERITQLQLRHLLRFVEKEYADVPTEHERMKEKFSVAWDMLWTFIRPGDNAVYKCGISEDEVCGKVKKVAYKLSNSYPRRWVLQVKMENYDYDCENYLPFDRESEISSFENEVPIDQLTVYPIKYCRDPQAIEERLLAQGAKYGYLTTAVSYRYMQFEGPIFQYKEIGYEHRIIKENASGRVMIDQFSYATVVHDGMLNNAEPSSAVTRNGKVKTVDISNDPNRIYSPAIVWGFSFRLKSWGCFPVHGFSEVVFDGGSSWNQLVMDPDLKEITCHLVAEHLRTIYGDEKQQLHGIDPISNKGEGCVIIGYGPPGTGKTLTAESLAEKLQVPLWSLSVSELGITPHDLETKLVNVLEVANSWHALLLLDEADVYLEKRTMSSDLTRNAMTGLFLRHLEYYKGVLFLTTNRILTFDEAFRSRISVFLRYPALAVSQREIIWNNLLKRANLVEDDAAIQKLVQEVAVNDLNGREIRNSIRNAQTLARGKKQEFSCQHVTDATKVLANSIALLTNGMDTADSFAE